MKTFLKIFLLLVLTLFAVVATVVGVFYFSPGLQRALVLELFKDKPGLTVQLDHIHVRFTRVEVRGFAVMAGNEGVNLNSLDADYSLWGLLRNRLQINQLEVRGLIVDIAATGGDRLQRSFDGAGTHSRATVSDRSPARARPNGGEWTRFEGILHESRAHRMRTFINNVSIDATLLLPEGLRVDLDVGADGWAPGVEGLLSTAINARHRAPNAPFQEAEVRADWRVQQGDRGGIDRMAADFQGRLREAAGGEWIEFLGRLGLDPSSAGEVYTLRLERSGLEAPLVDGRAEWQRAGQRVEGEFAFRVGEDALAGIGLAADLPSLLLNGTAAFAFSPENAQGHVDVDLAGQVSRLGGDDWTPLEPIATQVRAAVFFDPGEVRVNELRARLFQQATQEVLNVSALRPFALNFSAEDFGLGELEGDLLRIRFERIALQLLNAFVPDHEFSGTTLPGEGILRASQGRLRFTSEAAFGVEDMRVQAGDQLLIDAFSARFRPTLEASANEFTAEFSNLDLRRNRQRLAEGQLRANGKRQGDAWEIDFLTSGSADLAQVTRIPALAMPDPLSTGAFRWQLAGKLGDEVTGFGTLSATEMRPARYDGRPYGLRLEPEFSFIPRSGALSVQSPVSLLGPANTTRGTLRARIDPPERNRQIFDVELRLDSLNFDEWQPLIAALQTETEAVERDPTPDTQPPWEGFQGEALVALDTLRIGESAFTDMEARVRIDDARTVRANIRGKSGEAPLRLEARLAFQENQRAQPYRLSGELDVRGFDVTPFLRPPDPRRPGILEGAFDVTGSFAGTAPNLAFLADRATGDFTLRSATPGVFRPLGEQTTMATGVSGLLGGLAGNIRELRWIQEVLDQLKEIPYSQLSFRFAREPNLDFVLSGFDLVSRETRLRGQGRLSHREGADLLQMPADIRLDIFAKGRLAESLRMGNQIRSEEPDELGFLPGPPLPLRGNLARPESLLLNMLMDAGQGLLPGLLRPRGQ
ncbi:MAG: hypothetical protein JJT96_13315 [Opitutales bacterium]|nr:hypothetical protein [Opitutales bacterium]